MGHLIDLAPKKSRFHTLKLALPLKSEEATVSVLEVSGLHYLDSLSYLTCLNSKPPVYHWSWIRSRFCYQKKHYQCQQTLSYCEGGFRQSRTYLKLSTPDLKMDFKHSWAYSQSIRLDLWFNLQLLQNCWKICPACEKSAALQKRNRHQDLHKFACFCCFQL